MAAAGKEGGGDGGPFSPILALRVNWCEIPMKGRSGGWQPAGMNPPWPYPCTRGASCIPTQHRSLEEEEEEEDGEGCTTVRESPGIKALCGGERSGGGSTFCNCLQRVFLECCCSLGLPPPKKKKKKGRERKKGDEEEQSLGAG